MGTSSYRWAGQHREATSISSEGPNASSCSQSCLPALLATTGPATAIAGRPFFTCPSWACLRSQAQVAHKGTLPADHTAAAGKEPSSSRAHTQTGPLLWGHTICRCVQMHYCSGQMLEALCGLPQPPETWRAKSGALVG